MCFSARSTATVKDTLNFNLNDFYKQPKKFAKNSKKGGSRSTPPGELVMSREEGNREEEVKNNLNARHHPRPRATLSCVHRRGSAVLKPPSAASRVRSLVRGRTFHLRAARRLSDSLRSRHPPCDLLVFFFFFFFQRWGFGSIGSLHQKKRTSWREPAAASSQPSISHAHYTLFPFPPCPPPTTRPSGPFR